MVVRVSIPRERKHQGDKYDVLHPFDKYVCALTTKLSGRVKIVNAAPLVHGPRERVVRPRTLLLLVRWSRER